MQTELDAWKQKASQLRHMETTAETEIQQYKKQFSQLDGIVTGHLEEAKFWESHLGEDSEIVRAMSAYGASSVQDLLGNIEQLRENVRYNLKALDAVIGKVIKAEEAARDAILKKQNKMV